MGDLKSPIVYTINSRSDQSPTDLNYAIIANTNIVYAM
jgi:hypothetical protein